MTTEQHIENLKAIASDMPSDKCSDWIESLMAGINAMEELQAHREAWEKVTEIISKWKDSVGGVIVAKDAFSDILDLITDFRPKEGESNDSNNN